MTPCALCGGTSYRLVHDMGWRRILRCTGCGLVRADPLPSSLAEKAVVETQGYTDETAFPEVRDFFANCHKNFVDDPVIREMRRHLERLAQTVGGPGTMLDIGAGTGILMHLARERGWQIQGIDICSLTAEKAAREFGLDIVVAPIEEHVFGDHFDAVTMLDVLEHVVDPLATLRRARELLRPGGAIAIAVPNQRCLLTYLVGMYARLRGPGADKLLFRLYVPQHLHYFTPATLRSVVETAGFRIRELRQGAVYLGRYRMSLGMRIPLETVLAAGAAIGMNARLRVLAVRD